MTKVVQLDDYRPKLLEPAGPLQLPPGASVGEAGELLARMRIQETYQSSTAQEPEAPK